MKKHIVIGVVLAALSVTPAWSMSVVEFSPDPSTSGNWSYNGFTRVLSFDQDIVVDKAVSSTSDALVNASVYMPSFYVSGSGGNYTLTPLGSPQVKVTDGSGSVNYLTGDLGLGDLTTIGTVAGGYTTFQSDLTNVVVTGDGIALNSGALDLLSFLGTDSLDFELSLQGGSGTGYSTFAQMIDGGYSSTGGFSGAMSVPEPIMVVLLGLGSMALLRRRKQLV